MGRAVIEPATNIETIAACPIPCDPDCDAVCHADHDPVHKKEHWPWDCPAADRYDWGHPFVREAIKRLREERDLARSLLGFTKSLGDRRKRQRDDANARAEQVEVVLAALRAALGKPIETGQRFVTHDGRETEFDLHNEDGCGCQREERDLYAGPWRDALERAADEQGVREDGDNE